MVKIDRAAIRAKVQALLNRVWAARDQLRPGCTPLEVLEPAFIAKVLGLRFDVEDSLGSYTERGVRFEVAGILDRQARRIAVSRKFDRAIQRFTGAHEIAHYLLHPQEVMHRDRAMDSPDPRPRSKIEAEAEYFAACLLMPAKPLKKDFEEAFGTEQLEFHEDVAFALRVKNVRKALSPSESTSLRERLVARTTMYGGKAFDQSLADRYGVSVSAMAHRLRELDLVVASNGRGLAHPLNRPLAPPPLQKGVAPRSLLPTTRAVLAAGSPMDKVRMVVLQHALRDTRAFLEEVIAAGALVGAFVAKPNSINESAVEAIQRLGIRVIREPAGTTRPYAYFEGSPALGDLLAEQAGIARSEGRVLVIVDVGGYFCKPLLERSDLDRACIAGIVEVTTLGHTKYLERNGQLPIPVISIARSPLKEAEAVHVGHSTLRATEDLLQKAGGSITGKVCAVVGFGMIGERVARALKGRGLRVIVHDISHVQMVRAYLDDFEIGSLEHALSEADLVFSSTAGQAVSVADLVHAKSGAVLLSAGSRTQEFDVVGLQAIASSRQALTEHLEEFVLPSGRTCVVANLGKPVNFLKDGTPEAIIDLVFAEIAEGTRHLSRNGAESGRVNELPKDRREIIARTFLEQQKRANLRRD